LPASFWPGSEFRKGFLRDRTKAPTPNIQAPVKLQLPNFKENTRSPLNIESWSSLEIGAWNLVLFSLHWTSPACWITSAAIARMLGPAKIYFFIFGALTIVGGVIGYVKAGSVPSIIAGTITGVLLLVAGFILPEHRAAGLAIALITSLLLAGQFIPKFIRTGKAMPAGMMSILSAIGLIIAIVAWLKK
jgi:uncharacterized membrane protein (UPF0136 family)